MIYTLSYISNKITHGGDHGLSIVFTRNSSMFLKAKLIFLVVFCKSSFKLIINKLTGFIMKETTSKFPLAIFPRKIRKIIENAVEEFNFPVDYIASAILFAISVAIGNCRALVVSAAWRVKAILFMALLGAPGAAKTHPIKFAVSPFLTLDGITISEYQKKLNEWRKTDATNPSTKPKEKQFRVQDITMEGLTKILSRIKRGVFVFVDELKGWIASFNKYRSSGGDIEQWLSIWNSVPITINRKTQDDVTYIQEPFVGVIGGLQPGILSRLFGGEKMDNGFFYRLLFVLNPMEGKPLLWNEEDIPTGAEKEWEDVIKGILDAEGYFNEVDKYEDYHFTDAAWSVVRAWQNQNEEHNAAEEPEYVTAIFRKMQDYCLRFCLIIHAMREVTEEIQSSNLIDEETALKATLLADYFFENAKTVYELITTGGEDHQKFYLLLNSLDDKFTSAQAVAVGEKMGLSRATIYRYLNVGPRDPFIRKMRHGEYEKVK